MRDKSRRESETRERKTPESCRERIRGEIQNERCRDKEEGQERFRAGEATVEAGCELNEYSTGEDS